MSKKTKVYDFNIINIVYVVTRENFHNKTRHFKQPKCVTFVISHALKKKTRFYSR